MFGKTSLALVCGLFSLLVIDTCNYGQFGHPVEQGRPLHFCPVVSSSVFCLSFFPSPNLSRRRLDICHTSTHGVALVRIEDAGQKRAAHGSLQIQDAKNTPGITICAQSHNFVVLLCSQLRHVSTVRKKLNEQQYVLCMPS